MGMDASEKDDRPGTMLEIARPNADLERVGGVRHSFGPVHYRRICKSQKWSSPDESIDYVANDQVNLRLQSRTFRVPKRIDMLG